MTYDYEKAKEEALGKIKTGLNESGNKEKEEIDRQKDADIADAEKKTAEQIDETTDDYVDILRSAGIQKELDLRDIQETRANMGLSRSGLSATEQTAAILSAGNKTAEAQRNRQKAIDSLNQQLLDYTNKRNDEATNAKLAIDAGIAEKIAEAETSLTNETNKLISADIQAKIDAETKRQESDDKVTIAQIKASGDENKDREDSLYNANEKGWINDDTLEHAIINKLTLKEALVYEDKNKKRNNPTDDIYHGAANAYFNAPEGKDPETELANYLAPYDDEYDIGQVYMWLKRNAPYTRWAPTKDENGNVLKSENIGAGGIDRDAVIVDIVTGKRYTGDALYAHYLNYYKNKGLSGENLKAKATNAVLKIQKDAKVIS